MGFVTLNPTFTPYLRPEELAKIAEGEAVLARQEVEDTKAQLAQALARIRELEGN